MVTEAALLRLGGIPRARGRPCRALADFPWCYDEGMVAVASFRGVRVSCLFNEIAILGKAYPPAVHALRSRRDVIEQAIDSDSVRIEGLSEYSSLNHYLKEDEKSLVLFGRIPAGDRRRERLGLSVYALLAKAGRYAEALEALPCKGMIALFDGITRTPVPSDFPRGSGLS